MKVSITTKKDIRFNAPVDEALPKEVVKKGMSQYILSNGSFSLIDLIDYLLEFTGPATIYISTWVASQASIQHILDFLENQRCNKLYFLIDPMFKSKQPELHKYLYDTFPGHITEHANHAKFTCIFNDDWNITIETSANLNKNKRLENFRVTEDQGFTDFMKGVFETIQQGIKDGKKLDEVFA